MALIRCIWVCLAVSVLNGVDLPGGWVSCDAGGGLDTTVWHMGSYQGAIIAAGDFTNAGGRAMPYLAQWDGTSWQPLGTGLNGGVGGLLSWNGSLYVGGSFTTAGGVATTNLARWDGSWHAFGGSHFAGCLIDKLMLRNGELYVLARQWDWWQAPSVLSRWTGSGWEDVGTADSWANACFVDGNDIYIGGRFVSVDGIPAKGIARWDGTQWHAVGAGLGKDGEYNDVMAIMRYGGQLLASGTIYHTGDGVTPINHLAVWDGMSWNAFHGGSTSGEKVIAMTEYASQLIITGEFQEIDGVPANRIARWDGAGWHAIGSGMNGQGNALMTVPRVFWVGGGPTSVDGVASAYAAHWVDQLIRSADPAYGPLAGGTTVTLHGSGLGAVDGVLFGGAPASIVSVADDAITVVTPSHAAGSVDVEVRAPGQGASLTGCYFFDQVPVISQGHAVNVVMSEDGSPTTFALTLDASDDDGDVLTWSIASTAGHGVAAVSGTGASKTIAYAPAANHNGSDSFTVQVSDPHGGSDTATVSVTIQPVPDPPAIAEGVTTMASMSQDGSPVPFALTLHASDVDGDLLTWSIASAAMHGVAGASGIGTSKAIAYVPAAGYHGGDSFVVQASDGTGNSDSITVNVVVRSIPVISEGAAVSVDMSEDGDPTSFALTLHATDADGKTLTWSIPGGAAHGAASVVGTGTSKAITYTPVADYNGSDSFAVRVSDAYGGSDTIDVNVTIQPEPDPPVISEGATTTVAMSVDGTPTPFALTLHASDADGDPLDWSIATTAAHGTATASGPGTSKAIGNVPDPGYSGLDHFVVQVSDGTGRTASITVYVVFGHVPVITEGEGVHVAMSRNGHPNAFDLILHAVDGDGDPITWSIAVAPPHGVASAAGVGSSKAIGYVPNTDYTGGDSFTVQISDGHGGTDVVEVDVSITAEDGGSGSESSGGSCGVGSALAALLLACGLLRFRPGRGLGAGRGTA